jgi:hypothetical protein
MLCPGKMSALAHTLGREPSEQKVQRISMLGPLSEARAEISGMAWFANDLVLLPQFPARTGSNGESHVFKLSEAQLRHYVRTPNAAALDPAPVRWIDPVSADIPGFDGFEAIAFHGKSAFVAVESNGEAGVVGYLLRGDVDDDLTEIKLDAGTKVPLPAQDHVGNLAYEALAVTDSSIYILYEVNGATNQKARVYIFDHELQPQGTTTVTHLEYRITDATAVEDNRFWVTNVFWPGDTWTPGHCPLADRFGLGATHSKSQAVERLVELEITSRGLVAVDTEPLQFRLEGGETRNWEGLARLDGGFLVVTDEHPESVLGFVKSN